MAYSTKVLIAAWQMSFECSQPEWSGHSQKRDFKRRWYWHTHPAHTALGYANAGILAAGALLCAGAAAARRRRPRAWHARNFQSILIGTPSISSGNG